MSSTVLVFNQRELELLSDAVLALIENAGQAKRLVHDTETHLAIDAHIKELQRLNTMICTGNR